MTDSSKSSKTACEINKAGHTVRTIDNNGIMTKTQRKNSKSRHHSQKQTALDNTESSDDQNIKFTINPVKSPHGKAFKQRDSSFGPININHDPLQTSYIASEASTTHSNFTDSTIEPLKQLEQLSFPQQPEEKKKSKKSTKFTPYWPESKVVRGLKDGSLIKGLIRINPKKFFEAFVTNENSTNPDYFIDGICNRNRALDGDEVVIYETQQNDKKSAEVVFITEKNHPRTCIGSFDLPRNPEQHQEGIFFLPRDRRVPKVKFAKSSLPNEFIANLKSLENKLFMVKITQWKNIKYAIGNIIESLGPIGDLAVEATAILREHNLDVTPFGDDIREFLPKSTTISELELVGREDFRKDCVFTIDPLTARDLDDAMSCKELPNGNFEVGVHISDVTHYLQEGTLLDDLVRKKATTIYMVDNVYHMLPIELCQICSLLPGQDKLTFSVIWEITSKGEIQATRITRSVINSCSQLAYEHAQLMIDDSSRTFSAEELPEIRNNYTANDISRVVNNLQKISECLKEKRRQEGTLKFDQIKILFTLDPITRQPIDYHVDVNKASNRLIEQFMLLANITVAERIYKDFPRIAFLRLHEPPKQRMMVDLKKSLEKSGIHIDISSSSGIQSSISKYESDDFLGTARMIALNHLLAKPMQRARYVCANNVTNTDFSHFALSIPMYTHFTSPIRRYADIIVHRLLAACLKYTNRPRWKVKKVAQIAENCNIQKYQAKKAGEASTELYLLHYLENHEIITDAVVVDVKERAINVIALQTGTLLRIQSNNVDEGVQWMGQDSASAGEENNEKSSWKVGVKFPETQDEKEAVYILEMFSVVRVLLKTSANKIEAKLLRPKIITS